VAANEFELQKIRRTSTDRPGPGPANTQLGASPLLQELVVASSATTPSSTSYLIAL